MSGDPTTMRDFINNLLRLRELRPEIPDSREIDRLHLDTYDYPREMIQLHGGIPQNTVYNYVSSSFLNGLVNYAGIKIGYMLNRYGLKHLEDEETYASYVGITKWIDQQPHCSKFDHDDCILLGETESSYWCFWFDRDVSDCCVSRMEKSFYKSFEDFELSTLSNMASNYENWKHSDAPGPEFHKFTPKGWISW